MHELQRFMGMMFIYSFNVHANMKDMNLHLFQELVKSIKVSESPGILIHLSAISEDT